MTDDYQLFAEPTDGGEPVDPDVALISAYLSRELSVVQVAAVEARLVTDVPFRGKVQPILDAWAMLGKRSRIGTSGPLLTPASLESGWMRHLEAERARERLPAVPSDAVASLTHGRTWSMTRVAAAIVIALLPVLALAEVTVYTAHHPGAPGFGFALRIVSSLAGPRGSVPSAALPTALPPVVAPVVNDIPKSAAHLIAQGPAQGGPVPHALGATVAGSAMTFSEVSSLVPLQDGRVLVHDPRARSVWLFDSLLAHPLVVLNSTPGRPNSYPLPDGQTFLLPFRGDSALWFDGVAHHLVVIQPDGQLGRVMPQPDLTPIRASRAIGGGMSVEVRGARIAEPPTWSEALGFIFTRSLSFTGALRPFVGTAKPSDEDSAIVYRKDYVTGVQDSLGVIGPHTRVHLDQVTSTFAIFSFSDEIVATTGGALCIFHARDYRFEWIGANGARLPSAAIPYEWHHITAADRQHILDSITHARLDSLHREMATHDSIYARTGVLSPPPRFPRPIYPSEIPDVYPPTPFRRAERSLFADAENRVWIQSGPAENPDPAFSIWSAITRTGGVVERVRIPRSRAVVGFGPPGIVYLSVRDGDRLRIERVRIRP